MIADGSDLGVELCFTVLVREIFQLTPPSSGLAIREVWVEAIDEGPGLSSAVAGWLL